MSFALSLYKSQHRTEEEQEQVQQQSLELCSEQILELKILLQLAKRLQRLHFFPGNLQWSRI